MVLDVETRGAELMTPGDDNRGSVQHAARPGAMPARAAAPCSPIYRHGADCRRRRSTGSESRVGSRIHRSGSCVVLLVGTSALNLASIAWLKADPEDRVRIQVRLAVSTLATTAVIYAVGWGPMLVIAYGVGFAAVLQEAGSASWRSGFAWCVVGVGLGQAAIEAGIAPTLIDPGLAQRARARRARRASASWRGCSV